MRYKKLHSFQSLTHTAAGRSFISLLSETNCSGFGGDLRKKGRWRGEEEDILAAAGLMMLDGRTVCCCCRRRRASCVFSGFFCHCKLYDEILSCLCFDLFCFFLSTEVLVRKPNVFVLKVSSSVL